MSEPKYAYRLPPCPIYDTHRTEAWLEDLAKKGLILTDQGFTCGFLCFEKAQPKAIRYRILPCQPRTFLNDGGPQPAEVELAEELIKLGRPCLFMGDAADLYREQFAAALQENYYLAPAHLKDLRAASVAALAAEMLASGQTQGIPSHELEIDYLRKPQAEREREAKLAAEANN